MSRRYLAPKAIRALPDPVNLIPASLPCSIECPSCESDFSIDWLEKRPLVNVVYPNSGPGRWQRTSVEFKCPACGSSYSYPTDPRSGRYRYDFFGDDARREPQQKGQPFIYVYAFIGDGPQRLGELEAALSRIKESASPGQSPEDWCLHVTDLFSGQKRTKDDRFKNWTQAGVRDFLEYAQGEIAGLPDSAHVICGFGLAYRPSGRSERQFEHYMKRQVLMFLLLDTIKETTDQKIAPRFVLESGSKDGALHHAYQSLAHTPMFSVASHCVPIPEPEFEPKRPNSLTELADVVAFIVTRYLLKRVQGKKPELDPSRFGRVFWYGFNKRGEPRRANQVGFPWDEFFI